MFLVDCLAVLNGTKIKDSAKCYETKNKLRKSPLIYPGLYDEKETRIVKYSGLPSNETENFKNPAKNKQILYDHYKLIMNLGFYTIPSNN